MTHEDDETARYLREDNDLLAKLGSNDFEAIDAVSLPKRKGLLTETLIRAILRSRKQMADYDASNKKFTQVLGVFAMIQIIIAGVQFILEAASSENQTLSFFLALALIVLIAWIVRLTEREVLK